MRWHRRLGRPIAVRAAVAVLGAVPACDVAPPCPGTVAEAREFAEGYDGFVGAGIVVRYVPSPDDPAFRGYDVVIREPIVPERFLDTAFLQVESPVPGISRGQSVLLIGARGDRRAIVLPAEPCPPLTPIAERLEGP